MAKRGQAKSGHGHFHGSGHYARQIINCLEKVSGRSGYHPSSVFDDWTQQVHACLEALPAHLTSVARTGRLAEDTPETKQLFERLRSRYQTPPYRSSSTDIWSYFGQAFALLLECAEPGLWAFDYDSGYMGPDVLGHIFMEFSQPSPHSGQFLTPWNIALMMASFLDGKTDVYERLKRACQHPDNILAQATLLAGLAIEEPAQAQEWFINRVVPAAISHFEPLKICDPCVGSSVMLLASARTFEPWMVQMGLVQFFGMEIDPVLTRVSQINCRLYGLNGYALRLAEAVSVATEAQRNRAEPLMATPPKSVGAAIEQATKGCRQQSGGSIPVDELSFEALFKRTAQLVVAEEAPA
jgi:hypothetical protein